MPKRPATWLPGSDRIGNSARPGLGQPSETAQLACFGIVVTPDGVAPLRILSNWQFRASEFDCIDFSGSSAPHGRLRGSQLDCSTSRQECDELHLRLGLGAVLRASV